MLLKKLNVFFIWKKDEFLTFFDIFPVVFLIFYREKMAQSIFQIYSFVELIELYRIM
jgi:hypothetical protein